MLAELAVVQPPAVAASDRLTLAREIVAAADRYGIHYKLFLALCRVESTDCRPWAKGRAGEIGAFQVLPGHAKHFNLHPAELLRVDHNVRAAAALLAEAIERSDGSLADALARYNSGKPNPGRYSARVLELFASYLAGGERAVYVSSGAAVRHTRLERLPVSGASEALPMAA